MTDRIRTLLDGVEIRELRMDQKSGASLIDPIDTAGKLFFLERFPGISQAERESLKQDYRKDLPEAYLDFLEVTNGANILGRYLKIAGMPYDPGKYRGCKIPDPIRFVDGHRTLLTPRKWLFFATYTQWEDIGMAHVCLDCEVSGYAKPVYCLPYNGNKILKRWDSFEDWFAEEFERLHRIYHSGRYRLVDIVPGVVQTVELIK